MTKQLFVASAECNDYEAPKSYRSQCNAELFWPYDWGGRSQPDLNRIVFQYGRTAETAHRIGFNIIICSKHSVLYSRAIPKQITAPRNQWAPVVWTEMQETPEATRMLINSRETRLNTSTFPSAVSCGSQYTGPTAWGSHSSPNWLVYQHLNRPLSQPRCLVGFSGKRNNLQWPALPGQHAYCAEISMEATFAGIELEGCIMWQQVRLKACSSPMVKDCSVNPEPNPKRNVCQHSRTDKMSDSIGFNPVAQIQHVFFPNKWNASTSHWAPVVWTEVKERPEVT